MTLYKYLSRTKHFYYNRKKLQAFDTHKLLLKASDIVNGLFEVSKHLLEAFGSFEGFWDCSGKFQVKKTQ